jgi:hypothetical protein
MLPCSRFAGSSRNSKYKAEIDHTTIRDRKPTALAYALVLPKIIEEAVRHFSPNGTPNYELVSSPAIP